MIRDILCQSDSWKDFQLRLQPLTEKRKGDCFESLTKYFLRIHPTYATKLKHVWSLKEVPPSTRDYLNLPGPDEGIDLIAETREGTFWAIQCKYRSDETKSLTRGELTTFTSLAFAICQNVELALVCTNSERFSHKLKLYGNKLSLCCGDVWRALEEDFFKDLHNHLDGKAVRLVPSQPRPHQQRAILNAYRHFVRQQNTRGKLIMPCGTGKSLSAFWISRKLRAKTTLVAVPSLALIRQTLEVWATETLAEGSEMNWICVCSDDSVGDPERDDPIVLTQDLGIRVHTNPDEIAEWLKKATSKATLVLTTYQSGKAIAEASRKAKVEFDIAIMDEAHKTVGKRDSLFCHLLYDENIRIRNRIFMTATERRYAGQNEQVASMEDPELYGQAFELLTFKEALASDPPILSDYKIVTILVTQSDVAKLIQGNVLVRPDKGRWNGDVEAEMLAAVVALRKAMQRYPIRHAVSFHSSISRSKAFKETQEAFSSAFPEFGEMKTFHVSGKTPTALRSRELKAFAATKRGLVTNARCLTEGVDVPDIDCVLFADPKRSTVDIVQATGRALRPSEGKQLGYVVIPIFLDSEDPTPNFVETGSFSQVITTLRALAANDERIIEYFRSISQGEKRSRNGSFEIDVPLGFEIDAEHFISSVELQLWGRLAKLSWKSFIEAREYVRSLNLRRVEEWYQFCAGNLPERGFLPADIPSNPHLTYRVQGWQGYGDWLGTGRVANRLREFCSFELARDFARSLELNSYDQWKKFCKGDFPKKGNLPADIPANPAGVYKAQGWESWGDWLGTGRIASQYVSYRSFDKARDFARGLGLRNMKQWMRYCKGLLEDKGPLPEDIPVNPPQTYKHQGWVSWGDWLGTQFVATYKRKQRDFESAREYARSLALGSTAEWYRFCQGELPQKGQLPDDIPVAPQSSYKDQGWVSYGDWLGTGFVAHSLRKFRPFEDAKSFVQGLRLKNSEEWNNYCKGKLPEKGKKPSNIPSNPDKTYRDAGWQGMGDWLGTGSIAPALRQYRRFKDARKFAQSVGLKSRSEWDSFCRGEMQEKGKLPEDIPANPWQTYKDEGFVSVGDWLGTDFIATNLREYLPFEEARVFARSLGLKSWSEWLKFCKGEIAEKGRLPDNIPAKPLRTYKGKGWISVGDWLGTGTIASQLKNYRPFEEARAFAHSLDLGSRSEWDKFCRGLLPEKGSLPEDIPAYPNRTYESSGWTGVGDWLGTGTIAARDRQYRSFEEAREFARQLGLLNRLQWKRFCNGKYPEKGALPRDIPKNPNLTYRDQGWAGYLDWLGPREKKTNRKKFRTFEEARVFVRGLCLKNKDQWSLYGSGKLTELGVRPDDIPSSPPEVYRDQGWAGWGDWLGTYNVRLSDREYLTFEEARIFSRNLGLRSKSDWELFCRGKMPEKGTLPQNVPADPRGVYKHEGWTGFGDWLGTGTEATFLRHFLSFTDARAFARRLRLNNQSEWRKFCLGQLPEKGGRPKEIPSNPDKVYRSQGWSGYSDWLGLDVRRTKP